MNEGIGEWLSFDGRIGRQTYWLRGISLFVVNLVGYAMLLQETGLAVFIGFAILLVAFVAELANSVKRSHDRDKSGYFVLVALIPFIGGIWLLIELGFRAGTPGPNSYGPAPGMVAPAYT